MQRREAEGSKVRGRREQGQSKKRSGGKEKKEMKRREQKRERREHGEEMGNEEVEESGQSLEGRREKRGARVSHKRRGGGEEPTRERRRSEPVERRVPGADFPPSALQPGIVRCPPPPQGAGRGEASSMGGGGEGGGKRRTPGKEGNTPRHREQMDTGHTKNARDQAFHETKTKQKQRKKSILVGVLSLEPGHTLEGGGQGFRQEEKVDPGSHFSKGQVDVRSSRTPLTSLFPKPSVEQEGASLGPGDFSPLAPHLIHPHGQHVPVPGPLSSHGHLPPPGFSSDPTSLSPRVTSPSIRAFLGPLFFHHTLLSNLPWGPLRSHLNSCPKLLGTTEKSLR